MAKNGFKAMDSDMHVFEPADLWQRYIDKKYLERAPKGLNRSFRDLGIDPDLPPLFGQSHAVVAVDDPVIAARSQELDRREDRLVAGGRHQAPPAGVPIGGLTADERTEVQATRSGH